uniref:TNFR-Cys domain-containing protein n=1 Tax=Photinus pyralis TaxID=7054 RepID=A0A1Y1LVQ0_PHOPY
MEIFNYSKVMVSGSGALQALLIVSCISLGASLVCPQGKQFLHHNLQICVNCSVCDNEKGQVVLRPCEVHRDTICGPLSELSLDWKFLQPQSENRHRHEHHRHHHEAKDERLYWNARDDHDKQPAETQSEARVDPAVEVIGVGVTSTEVPFSSAETLVWDWQAIALTLAVFACILFFLVIALYSLHQAKQWRRLKENFEADVEELSARLSLMAASSNEKGEILEPSMGPVHDGNYLKNRCVYLEQLLNVRKDTKIRSDTGNVYIEESNPTSTNKT